VLENQTTRSITLDDTPARALRAYALSYAYLAVASAVVLGFDQYTKWLIRENIPFGGAWIPFESLASAFRLVHWRNAGAAFGIFQDGGLVFTVLAILVAGLPAPSDVCAIVFRCLCGGTHDAPVVVSHVHIPTDGKILGIAQAHGGRGLAFDHVQRRQNDRHQQSDDRNHY